MRLTPMSGMVPHVAIALRQPRLGLGIQPVWHERMKTFDPSEQQLSVTGKWG